MTNEELKEFEKWWTNIGKEFLKNLQPTDDVYRKIAKLSWIASAYIEREACIKDCLEQGSIYLDENQCEILTSIIKSRHIVFREGYIYE